MSRRYVIVGAGAVGVALAAGLSRAGFSTLLVSRGQTLEHLRHHGAQLTHAGRTEHLRVPVASVDELDSLGADDVIVLTVKTQDVSDAVSRWSVIPVGNLEGQTQVPAGDVLPLVTLQNGLEAERIAARYFRHVISATTLIAAVHLDAGNVTVYNEPKFGQLFLGAYPSADISPETAAIVPAITADFDRADWVTHVSDDPVRWKAWKATRAAGFGVSVLDGTDSELDILRAEVQAEAVRILTAAGFNLADPQFEAELNSPQVAIGKDSGYDTSKVSPWQSFTRGSTSEIDYLNGEIVLQARLIGEHAPLNSGLQSLLAEVAAIGSGPGSRTVHDLRLRIAGSATSSLLAESSVS